MELKVKLNFKQILQLIRQLPQKQKEEIQTILSKELHSPKKVSKSRKAGDLKGFVTYMAKDFDAPLEDLNPYME